MRFIMWNMRVRPRLLTTVARELARCMSDFVEEVRWDKGGTEQWRNEEIKNRLKSGNACYQSVQNLLSSSLLSANIKIKIHRTIILPVVLYGCETWTPTLREEHRPRVFKNRVLRKILGPKTDKVIGSGEDYILRSFMSCTAYQILLLWSNQNNETGKTHSICGVEERGMPHFVGEI